MRRLPALLAGAGILLALPATGHAAANPSSTGGVSPAPPAEGPGTPPPSGSRDRGRPVLRAFSVSSSRIFLFGRPARVGFQIADRSRRVTVRLEVLKAGARRPVRRIDLGERRTGVRHSYSLAARDLPEGELRLRIAARDPGGNSLNAGGEGVERFEVRGHHMPLGGRFTYALNLGRFGAQRPGGRRHQGQDLSASEGVPVLAPRGGVVQTVAYQAGGAGNYIVLDGDGEDRDYVFMHLRTGANRVRQGDRVRTGQRLSDVGNTGSSTGPHLHFEIWVGGWFSGGHPIDPLPHLRRWDSWS